MFDSVKLETVYAGCTALILSALLLFSFSGFIFDFHSWSFYCVALLSYMRSSTAQYVDWMGWGERMRDCVCVSQWAPPTSCIKAPCLVCRRAISRVTQLPDRASGNFKKPVEYSFTTESTRRAFSSNWIITELQVCALSFEEDIALLCFQLMALSLLFWGQGTSVEARTGYLSGYISSSALNVCVCAGIAFKVQSIQQWQYIIYCLLVANKFVLFNQVTRLNGILVFVWLLSRVYFGPLWSTVLRIIGHGPKAWL